LIFDAIDHSTDHSTDIFAAMPWRRFNGGGIEMVDHGRDGGPALMRRPRGAVRSCAQA
jgi:hypothetical protein